MRRSKKRNLIKTRETRKTPAGAEILLISIAFLGVQLFLNQNTLEAIAPSEGNAGDGPTSTSHYARRSPSYVPSPIEKYVTDHAVELGYDGFPSIGCNIWNNASATPPNIYNGLQSYLKDLENYSKAVNDFEPIPDLLESIQRTGNHDVCATARPHPDGIEALFPSGQLSLSQSGLVEPLLPPMRHQQICNGGNIRPHLFKMDYLVHDFEAMCHALKPTSKRVLIDMGASLDFHGKKGQLQPIMFVLNQFEKFGFSFDHIYAFEITPADPKHVYDVIPEKYMHNYHWVNVGVDHLEGKKLNPLHSILKQFNEDDLVIVKLDIDTASVEVPLAKQLLEDKDGVYHKLVDQFYFEHHVGLREMVPFWRSAIADKQTVKDSLDLFLGLREKGIPAHFWP